jgi:hypothetical protein
LDELVNKVIAENTIQEVDIEKDKDQAYHEPRLPITLSEALITVHTLHRYEKEYQDSDEGFLKALRSFERELGLRYRASLQQVKLDQYWGS